MLVDLQEWLGYDRVTVNLVGLSEGLGLFLERRVDIDIKYVDKNFLDFYV